MPRTVTIDEVDAAIVDVEYIVRGTLTVAIAVLENGFQVVGTSGCADPAKFDRAIGERLAMEKVRDQVWLLLGYQLRDAMHRENA